ncbi:hypothetical protein P8452_59145 [Trifolium repens]|nr:hypothetical protein P8452_59145 [Trifolium repens]
MASQSSSSSSNVQHLNKQNQLPNSNSVVQEHNFFCHVQVGSSSAFSNNNEGKDESNNEKNNSDSKIYSCNYCKGQYSSLQALGGHQNAHKAERALQMQLIKQKPLGVRMESSIQKSPCISPRIGLGALRLHDILNPSLVSMRNNIEGSNGGVASPGIGGATTSANVVAPTSTVDGIRKLKSSDFDSSGLDLSLKL